MSCFTLVHRAKCGSAYHQRTCRVGDLIWILRQSVYHEFRMYKFDINNKKYREVFFDNGEVIKEGPRDRDFVITSVNDKIYMWRTYQEFFRLDEFDVETYSWRRIMDIQHRTRLPTPNNISILDQKVYMMGYDVSAMAIVCLTTFDIKCIFLQSHGDRDTQKYGKCVVNGLIYAVDINKNGIRNVYQYDNQDEFKKVTTKNGNPIEYLKYNEIGDYQIRLLVENNNIYNVINRRDTEDIIIDCFNTVTKEWTTVGRSKAFDLYFNGVYKKGNLLYFVLGDYGLQLQVKVMNLKPSLETLSMIRVAEDIIANDTDYVIDSLPIVMRSQLKNMVYWKDEEIERRSLFGRRRR